MEFHEPERAPFECFKTYKFQSKKIALLPKMFLTLQCVDILVRFDQETKIKLIFQARH